MPSSDRSPAAGQRLLWLDAARGIAAIAVMCYHYGGLLDLQPLLSSAYLSVDLFFMMSGFVLSHSYEQAIRSGALTPRMYILRRLVRLYPTYLVATALGLLYYIATIIIRTADAPSILTLMQILPCNLLFVPIPAIDWTPHGMFPFTPASWSLSTEFVASILYGAFLARSSTRRIAAFGLLFGAIFFACTIWYGSFDLGWGIANFIPGIFRTLFEFTIGIALYRLSNSRTKKVALNPLILLSAVIAVIVLLDTANLWIIAVCTLVVFPAFILSAEGRSVSSWAQAALHELGRISYPAYLLHTPVLLWGLGTYKLFHPDDFLLLGTAGWLGWTLVAVTLILSHLVARWIDEPARAWLNARIRQRTAAKRRRLEAR